MPPVKPICKSSGRTTPPTGWSTEMAPLIAISLLSRPICAKPTRSSPHGPSNCPAGTPRCNGNPSSPRSEQLRGRPPSLPRIRGRESGESDLDFRRWLFGQNRRDLSLRAADDVADAALPLGIGPTVAGLAGHRAAQVAQVIAQLVHHVMRLGAPLGAPALLHPAEDFVDLRAALGHEGATGVGDAVDLAPVLLDGADVAHVLEHLQGRVNGARAGRIETAEPRFESLDQLVPVGGLVLELVEDDVLQVAALEHLAAELVEAEFTT